MPLSDGIPVIDDRRYADIVAEARARIPRYTPEWTDFNASDPGIALVELFGWMTELLMFRLGKVPQLNYVKFLELIGFELTPARAATAEISFPMKADYAQPYVIIPKGTQVATEAEPDATPVVFETDRAIFALTAGLDALQVFEQPTHRDVTGSKSFDAFGPRAREGSALLLGFRSDLEFPEVEIDLAFWSAAAAEGPVRCGEPQKAPAVVVWEYWAGQSWRPLGSIEDTTLALSRSGHVRLQAPPSGEMQKATIGQKLDVARYWIRARLVESGYQTPPRLSLVRANTATATQAETVELEVLGGSDARPDQVLQLSNRPVLAGSLVFEIDEGEGFVAWTEVPDLFGSGRDDRHFVLNRTTGEIRLGDGKNGRIPVANPAAPANYRARSYRVGGGRRGNVAAGKINSLRSMLEGVDATKVANPVASGGGADEESLDQAKKRAAIALKSHDRAVTAEDFELLATRAANIARSKALPLFHPDFRGVQVPGVVSVIVVPDSEEPAPMPVRATLRAVCDYLDKRRLLTTELFVLPPRYRKIRVVAEIIVRDDADLADTKKRAFDSVSRYFHPLVGGDTGTGWPFGGDVYHSLVMQRLLVSGAKRISKLTMRLGSDESEECGPCCDIELEPDMLLENGAHEIHVRYDDEVGT